MLIIIQISWFLKISWSSWEIMKPSIGKSLNTWHKMNLFCWKTVFKLWLRHFSTFSLAWAFESPWDCSEFIFSTSYYLNPSVKIDDLTIYVAEITRGILSGMNQLYFTGNDLTETKLWNQFVFLWISKVCLLTV